MFHLLANFLSMANTANTDVPALEDSIMQIQNGHHVPPQDMGLLFAFVTGVALTRARINSPKIRQVAPSYINPVNSAILPITLPAIADMRQTPFIMRGQEEIVWEATSTDAGPNNTYVISALQQNFAPAPTGDTYTIRATSTTAAVASAWTQVALTFETQLPTGVYAVIGGQYNATNAIAFQMVFDNQFYRPGGIGKATNVLQPWRGQRMGGLGKWGEFNTVTLPRILVLNNSTDNAHEFLLDIVRVR